jgi:AmmeMemoRadiSam system protein B
MTTTAPTIRPPAWAGQFYPAEPAKLRQAVQECLAQAKAAGSSHPKAVIAPHAGYIYSGPIAGSAFAPFLPDADSIRRIILLGPSHRVAFNGLAMSSAEYFMTPLGQIPLCHSEDDQLRALPQVNINDHAHANEHSLEVELPFLQAALLEFSVLPLVVGEASDREVAEVLEKLWDGESTRIVVSSDLSHYLDYASAVEADRITAKAIESLDLEIMEENQACGCRPIRGLLQAARRHGLQAKAVDLRNSGDTAGSRDRVVGYGAFLFCPE